MQVTNTQVQHTIEALRQQAESGPKVPSGDAVEAVTAELIASLAGLPAVRRDRADWARSVLAEDRLPTDDEVAEKLVGRLVCDRLR